MRKLHIAMAASMLFSGMLAAQTPMEVLPAQGNVYMLIGPGGNSAVQVGHEAVILVDTHTADASEELLANIRQLSSKPIRHIINTSVLEHHTGGNEAMSKAGVYIRLIDTMDPRGLDSSAAIMAHVNVLASMSEPVGNGDDTARPEAAWPSDTYYTKSWAIHVNDEGIVMHHVPSAVTDGDTIVFFRRSDVVVAGDIYNADRYPWFDAEQGGSMAGVIDGLNTILELTIAGEDQTGGTLVIPGHGRMSDETDVANYRDMATIIYQRIRAQVADGRSLQEIQQSRPTMDYDGLYGHSGKGWTGEQLVAAIYRELTGREQ